MTKYLLHNWAYLLFFALFILLSSACNKKAALPDLEDFTRADREKLGEFIQGEMERDAIFSILPHQFPYDSLYWFVQTLSNQATAVIRLDLLSPANNRWNQEREWTVSIFDNNGKSAFALPGGNIYLSTGLLKSLERSYELYYFLAFEANLMHEGYLLERLVREYNAITLRNLVSGSAPANSTTLDIITEEYPTLIFEPEIVESIDRDAVRTICQTSIFNRVGIAPFVLDIANEDAAWLASRKTYMGRPENVETFEVEGGFDCGTFVGDGKYQHYVLSILEQ